MFKHRVCGVALVVTALAGCSVVETTTKVPVGAMEIVIPGGKPAVVEPAALQVAVQRYADDFIARTTGAIDEYAARVNTDEARRNASKWKLSLSSSAVSIATGPNSAANMVDFVGIATLTRMMLEDHWSKTTQSTAFHPWLDASRFLETNAWKLLEGILRPRQQEELRAAIRQWHAENPGVSTVFLARPQEMSSLLRESTAKSTPGLVSLLGLDATAGLDPAVREITRTRLFAERAMFMAQRMPFLLRWQTEVLADQLLHENEVALALTNAARLAESVDRISRATESVSQTAAQLPDRITAERKAMLAALETQEGKLRELSAEITRTLTAGGNMSTSLTATLTTFDALMKRFGVGEPVTNAAPATNSAPFNILDYAKTAEQVTAMTKGLDDVLKQLNTTLDSPAIDARLLAVNRLSDHATDRVRGLIYLAFALAALLILFTFICAGIYRARGRSAQVK